MGTLSSSILLTEEDYDQIREETGCKSIIKLTHNSLYFYKQSITVKSDVFTHVSLILTKEVKAT